MRSCLLYPDEKDCGALTSLAEIRAHLTRKFTGPEDKYITRLLERYSSTLIQRGLVSRSDAATKDPVLKPFEFFGGKLIKVALRLTTLLLELLQVDFRQIDSKQTHEPSDIDLGEIDAKGFQQFSLWLRKQRLEQLGIEQLVCSPLTHLPRRERACARLSRD